MTTKSSSTSTSSLSSSSSSSCIVIEFGSSTIKVGIAGETQPRCIFPSFLISSSSSTNNANNNTSYITSPPLPYTPSYEYKNHNNHNHNHNINKDTHSYNQLYQQMSLFLHDLFTFHLYITHLHTKTSSSSSSYSSSYYLKSPIQQNNILHNHKMKKILIILPHHTSLPKLQPLNHNTSSTISTIISLSTIYTNIIQNILIHEIQITNYNNLKFVRNSIMDIIIPYTLGLSYGIVIDFGLNEIRIGCYCSGGGGNYGSSYSSLEFINIGKDFIFKSIWNQIQLLNDDDDDDDDELEYNDDVMYVLEDIMKTMSSSSSSYQSRTSTNVKQSTTTTTTSTTTTTTKIRNKILSKVSIDKIQEIISTTIHEYYFNIHNSNGLLYIFLKCILQYPIDVRSKVIRNICMVGGGMLWIQHDFERRFLESIYNLFEQEVNDDNGKRYKMKNERYKKFDSLAMLFMVKGPLKIVYPLPFSPAIIGWVGGSVLGALDSTFDDGNNSLISDGDNDNVNYELMHLLG